MSGNDGIRGYYYQVLAALLESVSDDSWISVRIEPSTKEDKVDIQWVYAESIHAVQVKSSINNFERGSLIKWVIQLVKDAQTSYGIFNIPIIYKLTLIGTTDRNADKWISDLHGGRLIPKIQDDDPLKEIKNHLSNVKVNKLNFDFESLQALSYTRMQEYLSRIGKETKFENIKTLCSELVNELFAFSLSGREMPKILFSQLINKHINNSFYNVKSINNHLSQLTIAFYEKGKVTESDKMVGINLDKLPLLSEYRDKAKALLHKAIVIKPSPPIVKSTIETEKPKANNNSVDPNLSKKLQDLSKVNEEISNLLKSITSISGYIKVTMPEEDIIDFKNLSKNILGIELTDEDFFFGGLEKRAIDNLLNTGSKNNLIGTEDEKEKYLAMEDAYYYLLSYQTLLEYNRYLKKCYPLPIILKNIGTLADEEIQLTLKFPKSAQIVTPELMKAPFDTFIEDFIHDDNVFNNLLIPSRDSGLMEYEGISFKLPVFKKIQLPFETVSYTPKDFIDHLKSQFYYEHFSENGQDIVQYEFKSLNPSRRMALPSFLLVHAETDFNIEYTITSKYLEKPIMGSLKWIHPENTKK
ncbi:hypothetical protein [Niallia sp. BSM11]|uniref:hypothetical protein n=1 Tax=Niallia sp. BSM11 TaxID=3391576 RepID=UPI003984B625